MKIFTICVSFLVLFSVGCSSSKDANESNFKDALNGHYLDNPVCQYINGTSFSGDHIPDYYFEFPTVIPIKSPYPGGQATRERAIDMFSILSEFELLTATTGDFDWQDDFGRVKNVQGVKFDLTDKGRSLFKWQKLCYGHKVVDSVLNFTEPTEAQGHTIVNVKYSYRVEVDQGWIKHPYFEGIYSSIKNAEAKEDSSMLVLTEKGWVHPREMM